jgi:hypothetical protein
MTEFDDLKAKIEKQQQEQENEINPDIDKPMVAPGEEYMALSEFHPAKAAVTPEQAAAEQGPKSLTESMDDATDLTDLQFAAKHLFPMGDEPHTIQIGRVAPEAFLSLLQFGITSEIMTSPPEKAIDIRKILLKNYRDLTIGLEGEGRIDYAKLLGAAREIKKEESLIKGL